MEQDGDGRPRAQRRAAVTDRDLNDVEEEYPHCVDRRTLYPAELTETERLTRWLSADDGTFESLEEWR